MIEVWTTLPRELKATTLTLPRNRKTDVLKETTSRVVRLRLGLACWFNVPKNSQIGIAWCFERENRSSPLKKNSVSWPKRRSSQGSSPSTKSSDSELEKTTQLLQTLTPHRILVSDDRLQVKGTRKCHVNCHLDRLWGAFVIWSSHFRSPVCQIQGDLAFPITIPFWQIRLPNFRSGVETDLHVRY